MAVANSDRRVRTVAAVMRRDESRDSCAVGLKGKGQDIVHQPQLFLVRFKHRGRSDAHRNRGPTEDCRALDSPFDVADGGEILIELLPIGGADAALETARI